jgi:hypothetical protein
VVIIWGLRDIGRDTPGWDGAGSGPGFFPGKYWVNNFRKFFISRGFFCKKKTGGKIYRCDPVFSVTKPNNPIDPV